MVACIGWLFISVSVAITNNFDCEKLDLSDCEDVDYCSFEYYLGRPFGCKKDTCLGVATSNASTDNGCSPGCNVATFFDSGFTSYDKCGPQPYLYVCTSRINTPDQRGMSSCFAGMVLSNGVCNKDTHGWVNQCKNKTSNFVAIDWSTFSGVTCEINPDRYCNEVGAANCQMEIGCALVGGVCVSDDCSDNYEGGTSSCSAANGCSNYTIYYYNGSGSTYTILTSTVCARINPYGSGTTPNQCNYLRATGYYDSPDEDLCKGGEPTADCSALYETYCGENRCIVNCRDPPASNYCTSASGIPGVTCSVQTDLEGDSFCSDGRTYSKDGDTKNDGTKYNDTKDDDTKDNSAVAIRLSPLLTVLLAAVLLVLFAN